MLIDSGHQIGRTVAISNVFWILRKYLDSSAGRYKFPDNGNVVIVLFIWCVCIDFSDFRAASDCTYFVIPFESIVVWLTVYPSVKIISVFFQLINRKKFEVGLKLVQEKKTKNEMWNVNLFSAQLLIHMLSELISNAEFILTLHLIIVARRWRSPAKTDCGTNNAGRNDEKTAHGHQDKPRQL